MTLVVVVVTMVNLGCSSLCLSVIPHPALVTVRTVMNGIATLTSSAERPAPAGHFWGVFPLEQT